MTQTQKISNMDTSDLGEHLLGRKIVAAERDTITLDDGTTLTLVGVSDGCAWFEPSDVYNVNLSDNVVTAVNETYKEEEEVWAGETYTIHVLSGEDKILDFDVNRNPTSGYYCRGITLEVRKPDVDA